MATVTDFTIEQLSNENFVVKGLNYYQDIDFVNGGYLTTLQRAAEIRDIIIDQLNQPIAIQPSTEEQIHQLQESLKTVDQKYKEIDLITATLEEVKSAKMAQLNELCNLAIVNGFDYDLNGVSYHFSCSLSAQANFTGTDILFKDNLITEAEWTVINNTTGKEERVTLDQATFNSIKLQVFQHINSNVAKFRNTLQPQVEAATTNAEVDLIVW